MFLICRPCWLRPRSLQLFLLRGLLRAYNALIFYLSYGGEGFQRGTESFTAEERCEKRLRASAHQAEIGMSGTCGRSFSTKIKVH
jgi:hypothetical protein